MSDEEKFRSRIDIRQEILTKFGRKNNRHRRAFVFTNPSQDVFYFTDEHFATGYSTQFKRTDFINPLPNFELNLFRVADTPNNRLVVNVRIADNSRRQNNFFGVPEI